MIHVVEEFETIRVIIKHKSSISRYGDGEFRICKNGNCYGEREPADDLRKRLRQVLQSDEKNMLIGIPRAEGRYDLQRYDPKKAKAWMLIQKKVSHLLSSKRIYYSAFITRPDSAFHIDCEAYWNLCKEIWKGRKVILVQNKAGKNFDRAIGLDFFSGAKSIHYITAPQTGAWTEQKRIYNDVVKTFDKDHLVLLAVGPTATVLAFDLHMAGYQALDLGHWSMFATRIFTKGYK